MSSLTRTSSFHLTKKKDVKYAPISEHVFNFDNRDLYHMHRNMPLLAEMGGVQGLASALRTDIKAGLPADEVATNLERRYELYGSNAYEKPAAKPWWLHCWEAGPVSDVMLFILCIAGVLSIILGFIHDPDAGWIEGVAILIAVVIVTVVGGTNNWSQEKAFRALDAEKKNPTVFVFRGGNRMEVDADSLTVGDVCDLVNGQAVPADGVIITTQAGVEVNESQMTGENKFIKKNFEDPFLRAGTALVKGECTMLCTAVGSHSAYGRIMASLSNKPEETPLQKKLERVAALIGKIGGSVAIVLFLVLCIRWTVHLVEDGKAFSDEYMHLLDFFIIAVTVIVVAVPEGLPLAVTISLAYSMKKMYKDKNFVRVLSACETMGNATTICSDKTGTLTQNLMTVVNVWLGGKLWKKIPNPEEISPAISKLLIDGIIVNSRPFPRHEDPTKPPEQWDWDMNMGNQTDQSLVAWLVRYGIQIVPERAKDENKVELSFPFDSNKKCSSIVLSRGGQFRRYFKGASERMLGMCDRTVDAQGNVIPLDKESVRSEIDAMTHRGLRTIGFCYVDYPHIDRNDTGELMEPPARDDCIFFGLVGIQDPLRPEAYTSVRQCQKAGIIVRMVTGDHLETAKYIARDCGILTGPKHISMEGPELRKLFDDAESEWAQDQLREIIPNLRVLARSEPQDKEKLVNWLKNAGEVVAVTGDGTNDAPALKSAHVGIAMGITGTDVAKQASKIVILDDRFSSIVKSVMWGRSVYDNIRKFVQFQLTVNVVALLLVLIGALADFENPLTAVQLLWVNLIMDTLAALALGTEMPTDALLDRKPYLPDAPLISPIMWRNILGQSVFQLAVLLVLMFEGTSLLNYIKPFKNEHPDDPTNGDMADGLSGGTHFTVIFNTFVFLQIFNEINARKVNQEWNVFEKIFDNWLFGGIMVLIIVMQFLIVTFLGSFADTSPIPFSAWITCVIIGSGSLVWGVFVRMLKVDHTAGRVKIDDEVIFDGAMLNDPAYDNQEYAMNAREKARHIHEAANGNGNGNGHASVITA